MRERGQASIEYVAALALVACLLAASAVALAAPDLAGAVVRQLRLGLCLVGADICRDSDAEAMGLEPCLVAGEDHARGQGLSVLFVRAGGDDFWSVQRLSDGRLILTEGYGQSLDAKAEAGAFIGPVAIGGTASSGLGFRSGRSWEVTEAQLRALMADTDGDPSRLWSILLEARLGPPSERFLEGGGDAAADLAAEAEHAAPTTGARARAILGRRTEAAGTTYYVDLGADGHGELAETIGPFAAAGHVTAEYRTSDPPVITLRVVGAADGDEVQTIMRLPLSDPADLAAARRVAFLAVPAPGLALRDLLARIDARGTVERLRYRTRADDSGWEYALGLGINLGIDGARSARYRELVDAQVLGGVVPATRYDCVGLEQHH